MPFQNVLSIGAYRQRAPILEDKEQQMRGIVKLLDEQQALNEKLARQVPVIVQKSVQEQPKKPKRKGFLGIFGKKEKPESTTTTTMLRSLNRDMIAEQQSQSRRLSKHADSLAARNAELNLQLQGLIRQMDEKVQSDLQKREAEIMTMRKNSYLLVGSMTVIVLLLLLVSYIIICRNNLRIKRYENEAAKLISRLKQFNLQNEELNCFPQKSRSYHYSRIAHTTDGDNRLCRIDEQRT